MCSLLNFPSPPLEGAVTTCEVNSDLVHSYNVDHSQLNSEIASYPNLDLSKESSHRSFSNKESARSAFLEHKETVWKRVVCGWYEHGIAGSLEELGAAKSEVSGWISKTARSLLALIRWTNSLHGSLFPHLALSNEDMIAEFAGVSDWYSSPVRSFAWHPHAEKFAIALPDDCVRVYASNIDNIPMLKHKLQKGVAQLAWKPFSVSILAVACQNCVLIWHVDPTSLAARPSSSSVQVLSQPGHGPVTCLAWCPTGGVLVSGSPSDTAMMLWDTATERCVPLRRVGGGGVSLLSWSPNGSHLLVATPSPIFRVWESQTWSCEKWTKLSGRCQTACWSPDATVLLFATEMEPVIYSLKFPPTTEVEGAASVSGGSKVAVSCVDLTKVNLQCGEREICVGGPVHAMVWDPTGERLAVQFQGSDSSLIAVFRTNIKPVFEVMPCGFIQGEPGETPQLMTFKPMYDKGAFLTVVWSSGRLSFIPLYFLPSDTASRGDYNGHLASNKLYSYSPQ